ncbi:MAG: hypothetical protein Q8O71_03035 [bacterium]|nr:hypothetical protein [bacterium]
MGKRLINKRHGDLLPIAVGIHEWYGAPSRHSLALHTQAFVANTALTHYVSILCDIRPCVGLDIFVTGAFDPFLCSGYAVGSAYTLIDSLTAKHSHLVKRNSLLIQSNIFVGRLFLILSVVFVIGSHDSDLP